MDPRVASAECIGFGIQVASGCVGHNVWVQQFEIGSFVPANRFDFSGPVSGMPPDSGSGIQVEVTFGPEYSLPVSAPLLYDNGFLFIFVFSFYPTKGGFSTMEQTNKQEAKSPIVREYKIGDITYIVKAVVKDGVREDAATKVRRLIHNDLKQEKSPV